MAVGTTAAILGGVGAGLGFLGANQQANAADAASRRQAAGVRAAQEAAELGRLRAVNALTGLQSPFAGRATGGTAISPLQQILQQQQVDPRNELLSGIQAQTQLTGQGFRQGEEVISPIAGLAQPLLDEQFGLLGLNGEEAQQAALDRAASPLIAEQERTILRNNAALGGVGGNVLAELADATRARTEAGIGNRLNQLSTLTTPSLQALQNISNLRTQRGQNLGSILGAGGASLADQEANRRQAIANIEIGQAAQQSQLAQNLGQAQAGGAAFRATNQSPLIQGLTAGLAGIGAAGGFGGGIPGATPPISPFGVPIGPLEGGFA